jgi:hypothetical protein
METPISVDGHLVIVSVALTVELVVDANRFDRHIIL